MMSPEVRKQLLASHRRVRTNVQTFQPGSDHSPSDIKRHFWFGESSSIPSLELGTEDRWVQPGSTQSRVL